MVSKYNGRFMRMDSWILVDLELYLGLSMVGTIPWLLVFQNFSNFGIS